MLYQIKLRLIIVAENYTYQYKHETKKIRFSKN